MDTALDAFPFLEDTTFSYIPKPWVEILRDVENERRLAFVLGLVHDGALPDTTGSSSVEHASQDEKESSPPSDLTSMEEDSKRAHARAMNAPPIFRSFGDEHLFDREVLHHVFGFAAATPGVDDYLPSSAQVQYYDWHMLHLFSRHDVCRADNDGDEEYFKNALHKDCWVCHKWYGDAAAAAAAVTASGAEAAGGEVKKEDRATAVGGGSGSGGGGGGGGDHGEAEQQRSAAERLPLPGVRAGVGSPYAWAQSDFEDDIAYRDHFDVLRNHATRYARVIHRYDDSREDLKLPRGGQREQVVQLLLALLRIVKAVHSDWRSHYAAQEASVSKTDLKPWSAGFVKRAQECALRATLGFGQMMGHLRDEEQAGYGYCLGVLLDPTSSLEFTASLLTVLIDLSAMLEELGAPHSLADTLLSSCPLLSHAGTLPWRAPAVPRCPENRLMDVLCDVSLRSLKQDPSMLTYGSVHWWEVQRAKVALALLTHRTVVYSRHNVNLWLDDTTPCTDYGALPLFFDVLDDEGTSYHPCLGTGVLRTLSLLPEEGFFDLVLGSGREAKLIRLAARWCERVSANANRRVLPFLTSNLPDGCCSCLERLLSFHYAPNLPRQERQELRIEKKDQRLLSLPLRQLIQGYITNERSHARPGIELTRPAEDPPYRLIDLGQVYRSALTGPPYDVLYDYGRDTWTLLRAVSLLPLSRRTWFCGQERQMLLLCLSGLQCAKPFLDAHRNGRATPDQLQFPPADAFLSSNRRRRDTWRRHLQQLHSTAMNSKPGVTLEQVVSAGKLKWKDGSVVNDDDYGRTTVQMWCQDLLRRFIAFRYVLVEALLERLAIQWLRILGDEPESHPVTAVSGAATGQVQQQQLGTHKQGESSSLLPLDCKDAVSASSSVCDIGPVRELNRSKACNQELSVEQKQTPDSADAKQGSKGEQRAEIAGAQKAKEDQKGDSGTSPSVGGNISLDALLLGIQSLIRPYGLGALKPALMKLVIRMVRHHTPHERILAYSIINFSLRGLQRWRPSSSMASIIFNSALVGTLSPCAPASAAAWSLLATLRDTHRELHTLENSALLVRQFVSAPPLVPGVQRHAIPITIAAVDHVLATRSGTSEWVHNWKLCTIVRLHLSSIMQHGIVPVGAPVEIWAKDKPPLPRPSPTGPSGSSDHWADEEERKGDRKDKDEDLSLKTSVQGKNTEHKNTEHKTEAEAKEMNSLDTALLALVDPNLHTYARVLLTEYKQSIQKASQSRRKLYDLLALLVTASDEQVDALMAQDDTISQRQRQSQPPRPRSFVPSYLPYDAGLAASPTYLGNDCAYDGKTLVRGAGSKAELHLQEGMKIFMRQQRNQHQQQWSEALNYFLSTWNAFVDQIESMVLQNQRQNQQQARQRALTWKVRGVADLKLQRLVLAYVNALSASEGQTHSMETSWLCWRRVGESWQEVHQRTKEYLKLMDTNITTEMDAKRDQRDHSDALLRWIEDASASVRVWLQHRDTIISRQVGEQTDAMQWYQKEHGKIMEQEVTEARKRHEVVYGLLCTLVKLNSHRGLNSLFVGPQMEILRMCVELAHAELDQLLLDWVREKRKHVFDSYCCRPKDSVERDRGYRPEVEMILEKCLILLSKWLKIKHAVYGSEVMRSNEEEKTRGPTMMDAVWALLARLLPPEHPTSFADDVGPFSWFMQRSCFNSFNYTGRKSTWMRRKIREAVLPLLERALAMEMCPMDLLQPCTSAAMLVLLDEDPCMLQYGGTVEEWQARDPAHPNTNRSQEAYVCAVRILQRVRDSCATKETCHRVFSLFPLERPAGTPGPVRLGHYMSDQLQSMWCNWGEDGSLLPWSVLSAFCEFMIGFFHPDSVFPEHYQAGLLRLCRSYLGDNAMTRVLTQDPRAVRHRCERQRLQFPNHPGSLVMYEKLADFMSQEERIWFSSLLISPQNDAVSNSREEQSRVESRVE